MENEEKPCEPTEHLEDVNCPYEDTQAISDEVKYKIIDQITDQFRDQLELLGPFIVQVRVESAIIIAGQAFNADRTIGIKRGEKQCKPYPDPIDYTDALAKHAEAHRDFLEACNNPEGSFECANDNVVDIFFEYWARMALGTHVSNINFGGAIRDDQGIYRLKNFTPENLMRTANEVLRMAEESEGELRPKASVKQEKDGRIVLTWKGTWTKGREITVTLIPPTKEGDQWISQFNWKTGTGKASGFLSVRSLGAKIISAIDYDRNREGSYNFTIITKFE